MPAIEVDDLVVRYGELVAIDHLSFTASAGAVTVVLGPNGAGKTSTIEVLEGYRSAAGGRVRVAGLDPTVDHDRLVDRIGVMLQEGGVYPGMRVREAVHLFRSYYRQGPDADSLVELVGLSHRARATWRHLSGGERQRLSLALALAGQPEVVFLDEPTAGVDVAGRQVVRRIVRDLADRGCAVLLATHELDEAEKVADHVLIIDRGRLVAAGSPAELRRAEGGETIRFSAPPGLDTVGLGAELGAVVHEERPGEYSVALPPTPAAIAALTAWLARHDLPLADLRAGRHRLEDVFLRLTEGGSTDQAAGDGGSRRRSRRRSR